MTIEFYQIISDSFVIALLLVSIIFVFGIVWRVEKELDISYKFLLGAIIVFVFGEILDLFKFKIGNWAYYLIMIFKVLFAILLLSGILTMRNILREMDGEKEK